MSLPAAGPYLAGGFLRFHPQISLDVIRLLSDQWSCMDTQTKTRTHQGQISETTDLGMAMLIAESEVAGYRPVRLVSTIREARELAGSDSGRSGKTTYRVWAQSHDGSYQIVCEIVEPAR